MQPDVHSHFIQYLKRTQCRVTTERVEVLDAALSEAGHFDADALYLRLKTRGSKVSRATVYNTLDKLRDSGIVARYRFGNRLATYEVAFDAQPHHHLICTMCGAIEEFIDKRVDRLARDAAATMRHELKDAILHVYGVCRQCAAHEEVKP
jgi:Fur family transcriptional regulator, ferric uptake regulator